uniref:hypothetical protein n=1 Tax=Stappia sp. TaxID=1870903 RepID=UPI003BACE92E
MSGRELVTARQVLTVALHGQSRRHRHVGELDDGRMVVLESDRPTDEPKVMVEPYPLQHAIGLAEHVLAGSPRHITHAKTPLVLAATLLAVLGTIGGAPAREADDEQKGRPPV